MLLGCKALVGFLILKPQPNGGGVAGVTDISTPVKHNWLLYRHWIPDFEGE